MNKYFILENDIKILKKIYPGMEIDELTALLENYGLIITHCILRKSFEKQEYNSILSYLRDIGFYENKK